MILIQRKDGETLNLDTATRFKPYRDGINNGIKVFYGKEVYIVPTFSIERLKGWNAEGATMTFEVEWMSEGEYKLTKPAANI